MKNKKYVALQKKQTTYFLFFCNLKYTSFGVLFGFFIIHTFAKNKMNI